MSGFWSAYITILVAINVIGAWALLRWTKNMRADEDAKGKVQHSYDGIEEFNNPLPRWWLWLFYLTLVFGVAYLALYPGLGNFAGALQWTQAGEHDKEVQKFDAKVQPLFSAMAQKPLTELAQDPQALQIGQRLFANNCATCHGSDAQGAPGFPNLTDGDWLYGGTPENIEQTIMNGRNGAMPAFASTFDDKQRMQIKHYVLSLSGLDHDATSAAAGKATFATICAACHGADAHGNTMLGAPNLSDAIWLYGGTHGAIDETLRNGRNGHMPAHAELLGADRVHVLAAYVYSLSQHAEH